MKLLNQLKEFWQKKTPLKKVFITTVVIIIVAILCYLCARFWDYVFLIFIIFPHLALSPVLIPLYFIFKKTQKTSWRIFWIAFLVPFLNFIYYILEYVFTYPFDDPSHHPTLNSEIICGMMFYYGIPALIVILCFPKEKLKMKKQLLATLVFMGAMSIFFFIPLSIFISNVIYEFMTK